MIKQELNWLYYGNGKKLKHESFQKYWQDIAERTREVLYIAKQSMGTEDYDRFKALARITIGKGYKKYRIATGKTIEKYDFIDYD